MISTSAALSNKYILHAAELVCVVLASPLIPTVLVSPRSTSRLVYVQGGGTNLG